MSQISHEILLSLLVLLPKSRVSDIMKASYGLGPSMK